MITGRADWGVPNWKDKAAYPKGPDELTDTQWRWEFLRRRHDYRHAWETAAARIAPIRPEGSSDRSECRVGLIDDAEVLFGLRGMCPHPGWADVSWPFLIFNDAYPKVVLGDIWPGGGALEPLREMLQRDVGTLSATEIAAVFDITEPIPPQIEEVKSTLKMYQEVLIRTGTRTGQKVKKQRRESRSKPHWPTYLRVLDAKDAGASLKVIGFTLTVHSDIDNATGWARDTLAAAEQIKGERPKSSG